MDIVCLGIFFRGFFPRNLIIISEIFNFYPSMGLKKGENEVWKQKYLVIINCQLSILNSKFNSF